MTCHYSPIYRCPPPPPSRVNLHSRRPPTSRTCCLIVYNFSNHLANTTRRGCCDDRKSRGQPETVSRVLAPLSVLIPHQGSPCIPSSSARRRHPRCPRERSAVRRRIGARPADAETMTSRSSMKMTRESLISRGHRRRRDQDLVRERDT